MEVSQLVELARQNLAALDIPVTEEELERAREGGFFATALAFQQLLEQQSADDELPDLFGERLLVTAEPPTPHAVGNGTTPDILTLAAALRRRETSSRELVHQALQHIAQRDGELNAFQLVLPEQAMVQATQADEELARGVDRGPLHGLPVALKDLIDLAGTPTTAGSAILATTLAERDATVVERLRAAGAIIIGKTRLPEFAYSGASNNPHYGPVRNPRAPDRDSGGSSSGSAAAVAAGMVVMAIGSDTGGSIRIPAAYCGLVGLKPTYGRVSLFGVFPLAWSLDHLGPITRTVTDAAVSLAAAFTLGVSLLLSALAALFPDVIEMYQVVLTAWYFLTPVFYPAKILPEEYGLWLRLNPMHHLLGVFRGPIYDGIIPSPYGLLGTWALAAAVLAIGWLTFTARADKIVYRL